MKYLISVLAILGLFACVNHPPPQPDQPDVEVILPDGAAGQGTTCQKACRVLSTLSCPESYQGVPGLCEAKCTQLSSVFNFSCVVTAHTKTEVVACGVRCSKP